MLVCMAKSDTQVPLPADDCPRQLLAAAGGR